jgi:hypothetical protein
VLYDALAQRRIAFGLPDDEPFVPQSTPIDRCSGLLLKGGSALRLLTQRQSC